MTNSAEEYRQLIVRPDGDLLWVTLNAPERANALSPAMIEELTALYSRPLREDGIRATLLSGAGKHFSAGADLEHLKSLQSAGAEENVEDSRRLRNLFAAILKQEALTIALVHGSCVAGGCGLATAHDFVLASRDARFMYSEVRIGFVAALVATFLPLRVRGSHLRELLLNPEFITAERALEIGLINKIVTGSNLAKIGEKVASEILSRASGESIARTKKLLLDLIGKPIEDALDHAAAVNAFARETYDCKRGIATFLETKSTPNWRE